MAPIDARGHEAHMFLEAFYFGRNATLFHALGFGKVKSKAYVEIVKKNEIIEIN